jgi:hypothetical protein
MGLLLACAPRCAHRWAKLELALTSKKLYTISLGLTDICSTVERSAVQITKGWFRNLCCADFAAPMSVQQWHLQTFTLLRSRQDDPFENGRAALYASHVGGWLEAFKVHYEGMLLLLPFSCRRAMCAQEAHQLVMACRSPAQGMPHRLCTTSSTARLNELIHCCKMQCTKIWQPVQWLVQQYVAGVWMLFNSIRDAGQRCCWNQVRGACLYAHAPMRCLMIITVAPPPHTHCRRTTCKGPPAMSSEPV